MTKRTFFVRMPPDEISFQSTCGRRHVEWCLLPRQSFIHCVSSADLFRLSDAMALHHCLKKCVMAHQNHADFHSVWGSGRGRAKNVGCVRFRQRRSVYMVPRHQCHVQSQLHSPKKTDKPSANLYESEFSQVMSKSLTMTLVDTLAPPSRQIWATTLSTV